MVLRTGFEPAIFAVKERCPRPLDDRSLGAGEGFEPSTSELLKAP
jgi:hypothetical protein